MRQEPTKALCLKCRAHCCKAPTILRVSTAELRRLRALPGGKDFKVWNIAHDRWQAEFAHMKDGHCPFLGKDDLCTIYDQRPTGCRTFPTMPERGCLAWPYEEKEEKEEEKTDG